MDLYGRVADKVEAIITYIDQYGYAVLFTSLMLELIALPLPGQILMTYAGFLVYQGHFYWLLTILIGWLGTCTGMTITYFIGKRLGTPFINKFGPIIHLTPKRIQQTSEWFNRHGNKMLLISYFIIGVRHFTGYFSGLTKLPYRTFALYAYTGALIWVSFFISLGRFLGPEWDKLHTSAKKYILFGLLIAAIILILAYIIYRVRQYFRVRYFNKKINTTKNEKN